MDVMILEQSHFPRFRPGETLHPGLEPLLERLGARNVIEQSGYLRHSGTWVEWGARRGFIPFGGEASGPWLGFQAPRGDFDHRMLHVARESGAQVREECATGLLRDENKRIIGVDSTTGPIEARYVVDASGTKHWLARRLGVRFQTWSPRLVARYGYMEGELAPTETLPSMRATNNGWTWTADLGNGRYHWTRVTAPGDHPSRTWAPPGWEGMRACSSYGTDVTWRVAALTAGEGWFLCGDAAGALDPSSSHGVLRAVMCGMMAAHLIAAANAGKTLPRDAASGYQEWLAAWFRRDADQMANAYRDAGLFGY
jgi:flavin-dependent dehydrogenase